MTESIKKPGRPKGSGTNGRRRYLTDGELSAFFKSAKTANKKIHLVFTLIYIYALRVGELVNIRMDDVNVPSKQITIRAEKGGKIRTYDITDDVWKVMKPWLKERKDGPWLFQAQADSAKPTSRISVQLGFYRIAKKAGITKHSVHDLRHSCASQLAAKGFNVVQVSNWLRHKSISSSLIYMEDIDNKKSEAAAGEILRIK